jgi:hypothetical protein
LDRLRFRGLAGKRSLAMREFALGIEALDRFVRKEPLRRVYECVIGVLALESEPVDPSSYELATPDWQPSGRVVGKPEVNTWPSSRIVC